MPKLDAFDHAAWLKGLTLDFTAWDGIAIKLSKVKGAKAPHVVKPAISVLTSEFDNTGRSLEDHRARVDYYGARYDSQRELFSNDIITDIDEFKGVTKPRSDEPWRDTRHAAHNDTECLELLRKAFAEKYEMESDTVRDKGTPCRYKSNH